MLQIRNIMKSYLFSELLRKHCLPDSTSFLNKWIRLIKALCCWIILEDISFPCVPPWLNLILVTVTKSGFSNTDRRKYMLILKNEVFIFHPCLSLTVLILKLLCGFLPVFWNLLFCSSFHYENLRVHLHPIKQQNTVSLSYSVKLLLWWAVNWSPG